MRRGSTIVMCGAISALAVLAIAADPPKAEPALTKSQQEWAARVREIAAGYEKWGRVDDEARWAPYLCRAPFPARAWFSASSDKDTHGRKLYSLFAKDRTAYVVRDLKSTGVGQVIVKEAWVPEEVRKVNQAQLMTPSSGRPASPFVPYASRDGKTYKASKKAGLFVMMKLDPKTPETDAGWVYATVADDLKTVTAVGKIGSCMECHVKAKFDRLFGLNHKP